MTTIKNVRLGTLSGYCSEVKMGSILRSEEMVLLQLLLQSDSAYACVRELGEVVSRRINKDRVITMG